MKTRKIISLVLAMILVFALVPVATLAEGIDSMANEVKGMRKLDNVWAELEAVEAAALKNSTADRTQVINAVYLAALNNPNVDKDSFSDFTKDGFFFTEVSDDTLDSLFSGQIKYDHEPKDILVMLYQMFKSNGTPMDDFAIEWFRKKFKEHNITKADFDVFA